MKNGNLLECRDLLLAARRDVVNVVHQSGTYYPDNAVGIAWRDFSITLQTAVRNIEDLDSAIAEVCGKK